MRIFYFDIDGTILREDTATAKPALAGGCFEKAVRAAGFDQVVCVGNMVAVVQQLKEMGLNEVSRFEVVFNYCDGVFVDFSWFCSGVSLIGDPHRRARHINLGSDWWYADDLASYFLDLESNGGTFERERGRRVYVPQPNGDGGGLLDWLGRLAPTS